MRKLCLLAISALVTGSILAQDLILVIAGELDIPTVNPHGLTWHDDHFWITDPEEGIIIRMHREQEDLYRIPAPRKNITGITFEGNDLWVLVDAWDTITYPHHNLPKTQAFKMNPETGTVLDSVIIPYYNVPEVSKRFMLGLAWLDSSLLVSINSYFGPAGCLVRPGLLRVDKNGFNHLCCAHPSGMEVVNGELWTIWQDRTFSVDYPMEPGMEDGPVGRNLVLPLLLEDSAAREDWTRAMRFGFPASDLCHDGSNFWLLDPGEKKLKMMITDTIHSDPPADTMPPCGGDSLPCPPDTIPPDPGFSPYGIEYLEVVPSRPTINDEVSIVSHTTFSSGGCGLREKEIKRDDSGRFMIFASHETGMLTYICHSTDTFKLGKMPKGYHEVYYELSVTNMRAASVSRTIGFFIRDTVPVTEPLFFEIIPKIPIAGQEVKIVTSCILHMNTWIDLMQRHITVHAFYNSCILALCRQDTLSLGFLTAEPYTLDYFLYDMCLAGSGNDSLVYYENLKIDLQDRSTGRPDASGQDIIVYPNPASVRLFIDMPVSLSDWDLSIFSVSGRLVHRERIGRGTSHHVVSLDGFRQGYYILKLSGGEHNFTQKISVIR